MITVLQNNGAEFTESILPNFCIVWENKFNGKWSDMQ